MDLLFRGPKKFRIYRYSVLGVLDLAIKAYERAGSDGVSPFTAMALLAPEPYYVLGGRRIAPEFRHPEVVVFRDAKSPQWVWRPTEPWHVVLWALKRYDTVSWRDFTEMWPDIPRSPQALRQAVRRNVEEPLAGFFHALTGKTLDRSTYSAALTEKEGTPAEMKQRMRVLKRAAKTGLQWNPNK